MVKLSSNDGSILQTINTTGEVSDIEELSNGQILVVESRKVKKYNADGSLDTSFNPPNFSTFAIDLDVQSDGKIIVVGRFTVNGSKGLARLNSDGSIDTSFSPIKTLTVKSGAGEKGALGLSKIEIGTNDEIYVGAGFNTINEHWITDLAKFDKDGNFDKEFKLNTKGSRGVRDFFIQKDGKLVLGTSHMGYSNLLHDGLVRIHSNGIPDTKVNADLGSNSGYPYELPNGDELLIAVHPAEGGYPILGYEFSESANFNEEGYFSTPYANVDEPWTIGQFEYDLVNNQYYVSYYGNEIRAYDINDTADESTDLKWRITNLPNTVQVRELAVSKDGKYVWCNQADRHSVYDAVTGNRLATKSISALCSSDYQIGNDNKLVHVRTTNTPRRYSLVRTDYKGDNLEAITIQDGLTLNGASNIATSKIKFYTSTDFYIGDSNKLWKFKLVTSKTDLTPNPNGTHAILDTDFAENGILNFTTSTGEPGINNTKQGGVSASNVDKWAVDSSGNVYIDGGGNVTNQCYAKYNIIKISNTGEVNVNFINVVYRDHIGQVGPPTSNVQRLALDVGTLGTSPIDTDGDGIPDVTDLDDDNDGIPDSVEEATASNNGDTDGDGIPDSLDLDSDNDGLPDLLESGIPEDQITDLDKNNDGVIDSTVPVGENGIADSLEPDNTDGGTSKDDVDYDNDGTKDSPKDTDGDGTPDFQDIDSDNDGISDLVEGGTNPALDTNNDGKLDNATDTDGDGIADIIDDNDNGFGGDESQNAPDTDNDGIPDYQDLDSDDDGVNDVEEAGVPDTNGDGMDDTPNTSLADGDNLPETDGKPNYQEPNGPVITGPDTDQDGIKDSVDGLPNEFGDAPIATTPDYFARIFTSNTIITEDSESVDFVVMIGEIEGGDSNGTDPVEYVIVKQSELSIDFDTTLTTLNGRTVNNKDWKLEEDDFTYKFIYTGNGGIFAGDSASMVGVNATFTPQSGTKGTYPLKVTIQAGSGGETNSKNNVDIDYIEF